LPLRENSRPDALHDRLVSSVLRVAFIVFSKTGKCLGLRSPRLSHDCWDDMGAPTLVPQPKNKRLEALGRSAGPQDQKTNNTGDPAQ
jgi:hypothetical protein